TYPLDDPHDDDGNRITVPEDQRGQAAAPERGAGVMKPFGLTYEGDVPWWILGPTMKAIADDEFDNWIVEVQFFTSDAADGDDVTDLLCTIVSVDGDHSVTLQPCDNDADPVGDTVGVALTQAMHITEPSAATT